MNISTRVMYIHARFYDVVVYKADFLKFTFYSTLFGETNVPSEQ